MSIIINDLSKSIKNQQVLDSISFGAETGRILGFLGPNGAGKSTTMKCITGYWEFDQGTIEVCGWDVRKDAKKIRSCIGYLPEHNPLYPTMYVREYLYFVAKIHHLNDPNQKLNDIIEITGLGNEQHKRIRSLSKGYKQRVGLAQAMIHDPQVLILDEPTSGLDPNQLKDIRNVVKNLGKEKTVILSTHIMQEVQAVCDDVVIISEGKIVANDSIENMATLMQGKHEVVIAEFEHPIDMSILQSLHGVRRVEPLSSKKFRIICDSNVTIRKILIKKSNDFDLDLIGIVKEDISIDYVFQSLTE